MEARDRGETGMYVTLSEGRDELVQGAETHGGQECRHVRERVDRPESRTVVPSQGNSRDQRGDKGARKPPLPCCVGRARPPSGPS